MQARAPQYHLKYSLPKKQELWMPSLSCYRRLFSTAVATTVVLIMTTSAYAQSSCSAPSNVFFNPFNKDSAHHQPIGTGAQYASDSHPATRDWLKFSRFGINVGGPYGVDAVSTSAADPLLQVTGKRQSVGLPARIRFPASGHNTEVVRLSSGVTSDSVSVIYDQVSGDAHELYEYEWNNGRPRASIHRLQSLQGLGHGTKSGQRVGTSASGVSLLFGILRGFEINRAGHSIDHALQIALPRMAGCKAMMLSRGVILPATNRDASAGQGGNNTGNIPYGALLALPPNVNIDAMNLSEPGRRLAEAIRNYGIRVVDGAGCSSAIRADQAVSSQVRNQLVNDIPKFYRHIRMVTNGAWRAGQMVIGGGQPFAPNCAFDAGANRNVSAPLNSQSAAKQPSASQSSAANNTTKKTSASTGNSGAQQQISTGNTRPKSGTAAAADWKTAVQFYDWAMKSKWHVDRSTPGSAAHKKATTTYERNMKNYIRYAARAGIKVNANTPPDRAFG
jgi:hypothetical protein